MELTYSYFFYPPPPPQISDGAYLTLCTVLTVTSHVIVELGIPGIVIILVPGASDIFRVTGIVVHICIITGSRSTVTVADVPPYVTVVHVNIPSGPRRIEPVCVTTVTVATLSGVSIIEMGLHSRPWHIHIPTACKITLTVISLIMQCVNRYSCNILWNTEYQT